MRNGDHLVHGEQGEVMGPGRPGRGGPAGDEVPEQQGQRSRPCSLDENCHARRRRRCLAAIKVGEKLYFTGASQTFDSGDRLVHGEQGEVMGPGTKANGRFPSLQDRKFPSNKGNIGLQARDRSSGHARRRRRRPGGQYKVGEKLYYIGRTGRSAKSVTASCTASKVR